MKPLKKSQKKLELRQKGHIFAREEARKKQGVTFKESAWKKPSSRNLKKT